MSNVISPVETTRALTPVAAPRVRGLSILLMALITVAFTALAVVAHNTPYFGFDLTIARTVQSIQSPELITLFNWIGLPGYPPQVYVEMVALILALWLAHARWQAVGVLFANLGVGTLGTGVKLLVARTRPSPDLIHVANPALDGGGLSFPAGHVLVYLTVLGFLIYLLLRVPQRALWQNAALILLGVMIALIGVSRIYSGEHWFSDVVGGYLFGSIGLWLTIRFYEWGRSRFFTGSSQRAQTGTT